MNLHFLGAAGTVTGSCYLVDTTDAQVLVDCGLFQGSRQLEELNTPEMQVDINGLDAVVLTHAHLDHTGRLPLLYKLGYRGPIYATEATIELAEIITLDSARIQESDARRENRYRAQDGREPVEPLYTVADAEGMLKLMRTMPYHKRIPVAKGVYAHMVEAGHLLGSTSLQLIIRENGRRGVLVFSGDVGPEGKPLVRDAEMVEQADIVIMESTYGSRDHKTLLETADELDEVLKASVAQGGKILVPAFAVGRSQEMIYIMAASFDEGIIPVIPVYLDSPMAIKASAVYMEHPELLDREARELLERRRLRQDASFVIPTPTAEESIAIRSVEGPAMVISTSGMCTGGRILHHLRNHLGDPTTSVLFIGYQGQGTLGRQLVDGADEVDIWGDTFPVRATVHTLNGFSGHVGQSGLMEWFDELAPLRPKLVLTHGEDYARRELAQLIEDRHGIRAIMPSHGERIEFGSVAD